MDYMLTNVQGKMLCSSLPRLWFGRHVATVFCIMWSEIISFLFLFLQNVSNEYKITLISCIKIIKNVSTSISSEARGRKMKSKNVPLEIYKKSYHPKHGFGFYYRSVSLKSERIFSLFNVVLCFLLLFILFCIQIFRKKIRKNCAKRK